MIVIKSLEEIAEMRPTCRLAAETLRMIAAHIQPGITTNQLNDLSHEFIMAHGAYPSPLQYRGFPKSICTSINHQVCHGIPSERVLREGDIVNVDITTYLDGYHGDTSKTFHVGRPTPRGIKIIQVALECLQAGIRAVRPYGRLGDIGAAIEAHARKHRCSVVREYCGHGIGKSFHEDPAVLHYGRAGEGEILRPGMVFTIEPMINLGGAEIKLMPDKWTVVTKDHSLTAQFEHTLAMTATGYEVLTDIDGEYADQSAQ